MLGARLKFCNSWAFRNLMRAKSLCSSQGHFLCVFHVIHPSLMSGGSHPACWTACFLMTAGIQRGKVQRFRITAMIKQS